MMVNQQRRRQRLSFVRLGAAILVLGLFGFNAFAGFEAAVTVTTTTTPATTTTTAISTLDENDPRVVQRVSYRSILPEIIYSVVGLESSGTRFVTGILATALGTGKQRNGVLPGPPQTNFRGGTSDTWVQHLSLPWGGRCEKAPVPQIQPVLLPGVCSTGKPEYLEQCTAMARDANLTMNDSGKVHYPRRWLLDLVRHKEFYRNLGVRQIYVVVVRDTTIARKGRVEHKYCSNQTILMLEEQIGTDLLEAAIRKYVIRDGNDRADDRGTSGGSSGGGSDGGSGAGGLPSSRNGDVVLVSYESLMKLKGVYVQSLYETLGIRSDYLPEIHDGNPKYVVPDTNQNENDADNNDNMEEEEEEGAVTSGDKIAAKRTKGWKRRQKQRQQHQQLETGKSPPA